MQSYGKILNSGLVIKVYGPGLAKECQKVWQKISEQIDHYFISSKLSHCKKVRGAFEDEMIIKAEAPIKYQNNPSFSASHKGVIGLYVHPLNGNNKDKSKLFGVTMVFGSKQFQKLERFLSQNIMGASFSPDEIICERYKADYIGLGNGGFCRLGALF